jgi:[ribosomal protein S18]-alanine N-acetyltransferase
MRHWITAANGILLVANPVADSNTILGYVLAMTRKNSTSARLYSLATAAAARGQGIGALLIQGTECEVRRRGQNRIHLEVAEGNAKAQALYESLGYTRCGYIEAFYEDGQNAIRMEKTLK